MVGNSATDQGQSIYQPPCFGVVLDLISLTMMEAVVWKCLTKHEFTCILLGERIISQPLPVLVGHVSVVFQRENLAWILGISECLYCCNALILCALSRSLQVPSKKLEFSLPFGSLCARRAGPRTCPTFISPHLLSLACGSAAKAIYVRMGPFHVFPNEYLQPLIHQDPWYVGHTQRRN